MSSWGTSLTLVCRWGCPHLERRAGKHMLSGATEQQSRTSKDPTIHISGHFRKEKNNLNDTIISVMSIQIMHRIHVVVTDSGQRCFSPFFPSHFSTGVCLQDRYCGFSSSNRHERHEPVTWQSQPHFINRKCIQPNKHAGDEEVLDSKRQQQISPYAGFKVVPVALKCC